MSGWLSQRLTPSRPPLFCQLVVASPLLSRHRQLRLTICDFASTSSSPSGCRNSQCLTYRATDGSRPLAASASRHAASASRHIAASQLAVSWSPSPMHRRRCHRAGVVVIVVTVVVVSRCAVTNVIDFVACRAVAMVIDVVVRHTIAIMVVFGDGLCKFKRTV